MDLHYDQAALTSALDDVERRRWPFANLPLDPAHRDWLRQRAWIRTETPAPGEPSDPREDLPRS